VLRDTETIHMDEIKRINGCLAADTSTIVLGDFNSLPGFKAPRYLRDNGFTDSVASVQGGADPVPTFRWQTRVGTFEFRIDYIFHDASFRAVSSRVIRNKSSDHYLVVSELELSPVETQQR